VSKILFIISTVFLLNLLYSCTTETPAFYIHKEHDFTIPAGLNTLETHFFIIEDIQNNFLAEIEANGIKLENIISVNAGKGLFTPVFNEFNYGALRDISIWMVSYDDPTIRKEIYYRDEIPLNKTQELKLLSGIANLKDFLISEQKFYLEIQLKFRNFVPSNTDNRFTYSFAIFIE